MLLITRYFGTDLLDNFDYDYHFLVFHNFLPHLLKLLPLVLIILHYLTTALLNSHQNNVIPLHGKLRKDCEVMARYGCEQTQFNIDLAIQNMPIK